MSGAGVAMRRAVLLLGAATLLASTACAPMTGAPSFSLMSRAAAVDEQFVAVGERAEATDCFTWALILVFSGNLAPTHESVVTRMLEEHDADAILGARVTTSQFGVPYLFLRTCATVEGTPARRAAQ